MILIVITETEHEVYRCDDKAWAQYWFNRIIEKGHFNSEPIAAYLFDNSCELPCKDWINEYYNKQAVNEEEYEKDQRRRTYEKLKKEFNE